MNALAHYRTRHSTMLMRRPRIVAGLAGERLRGEPMSVTRRESGQGFRHDARR